MSTTVIYLIRHGQSLGNLEDKFLGHTDLPLTELGHRQAQVTAEFLKNFTIDYIYSSDLSRAYQTAKHTADLLNMEIRTDTGLREIFAGAWENLKFDSLINRFPASFHIWETDFNHARCDDGESVLELQSRFMNTLRTIAERHPGKAILIFTHATPLRCLAASCINQDPDIQNIPWASNASLTTVEYNDGNFSMVKYNRDDFLGSIVTRLE